ncbi:MAG: M50 family metallopeptidase [Muribaculaceae bacterium]|nr:M50 family metallopeptidase [Muribaculaceae bacterium]
MKKTAIVFILSCIIGLALGIGAAMLFTGKSISLGPVLLESSVIIIGFVLAAYLHIILHEAGHLICGLASGYRFVSFRVGTLTFINQGGRTRVKRFSIAGTGGQCLMSPPTNVPLEQIPTMLYNAGGVLMNLLLSGLSLAVYFMIPHDYFITRELLLCFTLIGFFLAIINGVPLKMGGIANDGYNMLNLTKDPQGTRDFAVQLLVNEQSQNGVRMSEMPAEWFTENPNLRLSDPIQVNAELMRAAREIDSGLMQQAMQRLLPITTDKKVIPLLANEAKCALATAFYLTGQANLAAELLNKPLMDYIRAHASVMSDKQLLLAAKALLTDGNRPEAERIAAEMERKKDEYLLQGDLAANLEFIRQLLATPEDADKTSAQPQTEINNQQ